MSLRLPGQMPRVSPRFQAWLRWMTFAALMLLALVLLTHRVFNSDIWWHVKTGERILDGDGIPRTDPYSYTALGNEWTDMHWGFQVLAALAWRFAGGVGLNLLLYACAGAALLITARNQYDRRYWSLTAVMMLLLLLGANTRFLVRPETLTFVFLSLTVAILMHHRESRGGRWLWALPPLVVLWANVQGLFVLALVLVALTVVAEVLLRTWPSRLRWEGPGPLPPAEALRLGVVGGLCVVAALVTPYTWRGLLFPFTLFTRVGGGQNVFSEVIAEFQPTYQGNITAPTYAAGIALILLLAVLVANLRSQPKGELLWIFAFVFLGLTARRNATVAMFVLTPVVVGGATALIRRAERRALWDLPGLRSWVQAGLGVAVTLVALWHVPRIMRDRYYVDDRRAERFGLGIADDIFPGAAFDFIRLHDLPGPLFNSMYIGGFAIYEFAPEYRLVSLDSRLEVHTAATIARYVAAAENPRALQGLLRQLDARTAVITHNSQDVGRLFASFLQLPDWHLVYYDACGAVFGRTDAVLARGVRPVRFPVPREALPEPVSAGVDFRTPPWARAVEGAVDRLHLGPRFPAAVFNLGNLYTQVGRPDLAEPLFEAGVAQYPAAATGWYNLGVARQAVGELPLAEAAYERAVALRPDFASAWVNLGQLADLRGDRTAARRAYERAVRADGENRAARYNLAATLIQAGEYRRAYGHLRRLTQLEPSSGPWQFLYGRTCWHVGRFVEAAQAFKRATELTPNAVRYWLEFSDFLFVVSENAHQRNAVARVLGLDPRAVDPETALHDVGIAALHQAFELNPNAPGVRRRLAALGAPVAP